MGTYYQPITIPVKINVDQERETVTITGKKGTWTFEANRIVEFKGLPTNYLIHKVYPNGVTLISSDTSVPRFYTWKTLLSGDNIFLDAVNITGWMTIK